MKTSLKDIEYKVLEGQKFVDNPTFWGIVKLKITNTKIDGSYVSHLSGYEAKVKLLKKELVDKGYDEELLNKFEEYIEEAQNHQNEVSELD